MEDDGIVTYTPEADLAVAENADSYQEIQLVLMTDPDDARAGSYAIGASCKWIVMPTMRLTDCFGITATGSGIRFIGDTGIPSATGYYQYNYWFGGNTELRRYDFSGNDFKVVSGDPFVGVGVTFDLPRNDSQYAECYDFFVSMRIRTRLEYPDMRTFFNVVASYRHAYVEIFNPSISVDSSGVLGFSWAVTDAAMTAGLEYEYIP